MESHFIADLSSGPSSGPWGGPSGLGSQVWPPLGPQETSERTSTPTSSSADPEVGGRKRSPTNGRVQVSTEVLDATQRLRTVRHARRSIDVIRAGTSVL